MVSVSVVDHNNDSSNNNEAGELKWIRTLYNYIKKNSHNPEKYLYFNVGDRFDIYLSIDKPDVVFSVIFDHVSYCDYMIQFDCNGCGCISGITDEILDMFKLGSYNSDHYTTLRHEYGIDTEYEINDDGMEIFVIVQNKLRISICSDSMVFECNNDPGVRFQFYNYGEVVILEKL